MLQVKALFERSNNLYWDDPYISKNLLNAHLSEHLDSASRNFSFMKASIKFMNGILKDYDVQTICDYGCGPGLYTKKLSELGYTVTGIDFSKRSIDFAKTQDSQTQYRCENYLNTQDIALYDFASLIYCDYGSLSQKNRALLLKNIHRSLKQDGLFLLDVFSVNKFMCFQEEKSFILHEKESFWYEKEHLELFLKQSFENYITLKKTVVIAEEETKVINRWYQYFTKDMIEKECEEAGFEVLEIYCDVKGSPLETSSETMALLLQKK